MHQIEQEQNQRLADLISENHIQDIESAEKETNPQPHHFETYPDFFHASKYGVAKASKLWMDMISARDKFAQV